MSYKDAASYLNLSSDKKVSGPLKNTASAIFYPEDYGAKGNGQSNDTIAINNSIDAASDIGGGIIKLGAKTYVMEGYLDGTKSNIIIQGVNNLTRIIAGSSSAHGIINTDFNNQNYNGYIFNDLIFDNRYANQLINIGYSKDVVFNRCKIYSNMIDQSPTQIFACKRFIFNECSFIGVRNADNGGPTYPPIAPHLKLGQGISIKSPCTSISFKKCLFHYNDPGIAWGGNYESADISIDECEFIGDWWDCPYKRMGFSDAYSSAPQSINGGGDGKNPWWTVTCLSLPGSGFLTDGIINLANKTGVLSIDIVVASGSWLNLYGDAVSPASGSFGMFDIKNGDVIETSDGYRAEVMGVSQGSFPGIVLPVLKLDRWGTLDTYEYTYGYPSSNSKWTAIRRYAASVITASHNLAEDPTPSSVQLSYPLVNPKTGEQLTIPMSGLKGYILPLNHYSGAFAYNTKNLKVTNSKFRGSWADQLSLNASNYSTVTNNTFIYGQDVGLTIEYVGQGTVVANNIFLYSGSAAIFASDRDCIINGNMIDSWGCVHRPYDAFTAIEVGNSGNRIYGNTFLRSPTLGFGGNTRYCVLFGYNSCGGSSFVNNYDNASTNATVYAAADGIVKPGDVIVNGIKSIEGPSAHNVAISSDFNQKIFLGSGAPINGGPYILGDRVKNTKPFIGSYDGWVCISGGSPGMWNGFGLIQ
jgi:hypothetical protein